MTSLHLRLRIPLLTSLVLGLFLAGCGEDDVGTGPVVNGDNAFQTVLDISHSRGGIS